MSNTVIAHFKAKPESVSEFADIMATIKTELPKAEGCSGVDVQRGLEDKTQFILIEKWDSKEQHANYIQQIRASEDWGKIVACLAEEPRSGYFDAF